MAISTSVLTEAFLIYLAAEGQSASVLASMREATKDSRRADALERLQPILGALPFIHPEIRRKADEALASKNLPTLSKLRMLLKKKYRHIISRGRIKNVEEFYLVTELLGGPTYDELTEADLAALIKLRGDFETTNKTPN